MSRSFSNNINSLNTTVNVLNYLTVVDDRSNILAWLSPLDPRPRHQDIQGRRIEGVGEWLLKAGEFKRWYNGSENGCDNRVLFCYGDPGVGKTFISSLVIDSLCDQAGGQGPAVACFYFDFAVQKEQSPTSMLGALLKQLVAGLEEVPEEIARVYQGQKKAIGGRGPRLSDLVKMLQTTSSKGRTFICIDALDECVAEHRVTLLNSINQILQESPETRIFVTGRSHIRLEIEKRLAGRAASVSVSPGRRDIIRYLQTRLDEDTIPDAMDSSLEAEILKKIPDEISEIFLLVSLNIDAILQETTIHRRRQKLNAMTHGLGLGDAYGATLDRIKGQGEERSRLGMAALMWISHSERPLKADELCHALAVEIGSPDLDTDNAPSIGTLLVCCQGLVTVDQEASTVRLIHFTLYEYLRSPRGIFGAAHSIIAETCLSYLNSRLVKALSTDPFPDLHGTPFLEYSSLYWGIHAKRDLSDCAKALAFQLFDNYNNHLSTQILLKAQKCYSYVADLNKSSLSSGLHCASIFGIVEIVAGLVEMEGCDINQKDSVGNTSLIWAAWNGHKGVVEVLLGRGEICPDEPDMYGRTPLYCSAWNGHDGVVKILLGRDDVDPDKPDMCGQTPFSCAAECGREGVVKILLERVDVNPDKPDMCGRTPLYCSAWNGHGGVVELLLGQDKVKPDQQNGDGRTALWRAALSGHEGVVRMLLEQDNVSPDKPDMCGQTPLYCSARNGHQEVMKILLERADVNPNKPNMHGQTPLWCAAWNGHEEALKILIGRDGVDPDKPESDGKTPLWAAAECGHQGVVKILLGCNDVNPDKPDNEGRTPLWCAAWNGHERVVETLSGREDVNPNKPDMCGETPLLAASRNGHEGAVNILLRRDDVKPDKTDSRGITPLQWASAGGHAGVIALLQPLESATPSTA